MSRRLPPDQALARAQARLDAAHARAREATRRSEARRRIVLGGAVLALSARDPSTGAALLDTLGPLITRPADRRSVGLPVDDDAAPVPPSGASLHDDAGAEGFWS